MLKDNLREKVKEIGGIRKLAKELGIPYSSLWDKIKREEEEERLASFISRKLNPSLKIENPKEGEQTKYFILSSAQDSSDIDENFLKNLRAFSDFIKAEIMIAGFTYNKSLFEDHSKRSGIFHPEILPYMVWNRVELGDLLFLAEMNTSPSATNPLSGFETYTKDKWGVFPHPKVQMVSIPTHKQDKPKLLYTTGAITKPNYVPKKAGLKAEFDHVIGAMLVELCDDGSYFCRHIIADDDGSFQDLDTVVKDGKVTTGNTVEALVYGDIHHEKLSPEVAKATWGYNPKTNTTETAVNLLDWLKPKYQFFHDLSDFDPRNHHNISDVHFRFQRHHLDKGDNVEEAIIGCGLFLQETARSFCQSVVVRSNHDDALVKWLKTADYKSDPENAIFFLETQAEYLRQLKAGVKNPDILEHVIRERVDINPLNIYFNSEDESFLICNDDSDGIEMGMHGHLGSNGSRATPGQFSKIGKKTCTGHQHTASITGGAYVAGVSAKLDLGYNVGLGSWSQSHILVYPNGKRVILTMMNGRFFG